LAALSVTSGAVPSRTEAVHAAIKHAILTGELPPGLPLVETDLASMLGVSKTPVREALKTLAGAGLVTMSPYKGAVVRVIGDTEARHLYDLRMLLEPEGLLRSPCPYPDALRRADDALRRAEAAGEPAERSLANRDFHRELYAGCGNPMLVQILDDLRDQVVLISVAAWQRSDSSRQEAAEHRAILDALRAGDAGTAADLLRTHIGGFMNRVFPERHEEDA
jgi:DNA-binding GntR family transcriptional regulator